MRKLTIHFSRSTKKFNQFSRLLQWYEGIPVSHVLVEFETPHLGQNFVYHSVVGTGVSFMSRSKFDSINEIMETYVLEIEEDQYVELRNALLAECGESYAFMQNIGIFIVDIIRKLGVSIENPFKDGQNCSELIYRYIIQSLYPGDYNTTPDLVKPSEIRNILKKHGNLPVFSKIN